MNRLRYFLIISIFVVLSPIVFLLLAEFAVAMLIPQKSWSDSAELYQRDEVLGGLHVPVPNYVGKHFKPDFGAIDIRTNARGMRDHREYQTKKDRVFRILAIGDSFTWGFGVPYKDTYLLRLEQLLNNGHSPERVEIVKAGIPAYQTPDSLDYLKHYGLELQPDMVMLGFIGEDMIAKDRHNRHQTAKQRDSFWRVFKASNLAQAERRLRRSSHLYSLLASLLNQGPQLRWLVQNKAADSFVLSHYPPKWKKYWEDTAGHLAEMQTVLKAADIPFVIVVIPLRLQVLLNQWQLKDDRFDVNKPAKLVKAFGDEHGVPVIDLMPDFVAAAQEQALYFPVDGHPNATATRMMAEVLNVQLRQLSEIKMLLDTELSSHRD